MEAYPKDHHSQRHLINLRFFRNMIKNYLTITQNEELSDRIQKALDEAHQNGVEDAR